MMFCKGLKGRRAISLTHVNLPDGTVLESNAPFILSGNIQIGINTESRLAVLRLAARPFAAAKDSNEVWFDQNRLEILS